MHRVERPASPSRILQEDFYTRESFHGLGKRYATLPRSSAPSDTLSSGLSAGLDPDIDSAVARTAAMRNVSPDALPNKMSIQPTRSSKVE